MLLWLIISETIVSFQAVCMYVCMYDANLSQFTACVSGHKWQLVKPTYVLFINLAEADLLDFTLIATIPL